jgi:cytochrome c oxidase subunit 4
MAHHPTPKNYLFVFIALMILLALTVAAAHVDFDAHLPGHGWSVAVALTIALIKGILIVLIFMHVKFGKRTIWAFAGAGFFWLGILFALTFSEYFTRSDPPALNFKGEPRYLVSPLNPPVK